MSIDINMQKRIIALKKEIENLKIQKKVYLQTRPKYEEVCKQIEKARSNSRIARQNLKKNYSSKANKELSKKIKQEWNAIENKMDCYNSDCFDSLSSINFLIHGINYTIEKKIVELNKLQKLNKK